MFLTDLLVTNAIKYGNLYLKPASLYPQIGRSVRLFLTQHNETPDYLGRRGTCTLLKFKDRHFVVCTRHQLEIKRGLIVEPRVLESILFASFSDPHKLTNIPVTQCYFDRSDPNEEFHDILIFLVDANWDKLNEESPYFIKIEPFRKEIRNASYFVGHPSLDGVISYDPLTINMKTVLSDCTINTKFSTNNRFYRQYTYPHDGKILDGYSGGAVFSILGALENLEFVFDGIIVRASGGKLHIVDSDFLDQFIKLTYGSPPQ